jgi:putative transcriptional regulator
MRVSRRELMLRKKLGGRIRQLRTQKAWSQARLASFCSLTPHHLGKIERGSANATLATLLSIAKPLKVRLADLFKGLV